jgi:hemerythrin-like domain-containing protein
MQAVRTILDEHRSLAAVLHGMLYIVHDIRDSRSKPNFEVLGAMIYYIDAFPERYHHPKEDKYLFSALRRRHPEAASLLDGLERGHRAGAEKIRVLEQALARYQQGGPAEFSNFLAAVESYADFHWDHMRVEEKQVLPLAQQHLTEADWKIIDDAFAGHSDPMLGSESGRKFDALFTRIVNLAPPPIGVGPETQRS